MTLIRGENKLWLAEPDLDLDFDLDMDLDRELLDPDLDPDRDLDFTVLLRLPEWNIDEGADLEPFVLALSMSNGESTCMMLSSIFEELDIFISYVCNIHCKLR